PELLVSVHILPPQSPSMRVKISEWLKRLVFEKTLRVVLLTQNLLEVKDQDQWLRLDSPQYSVRSKPARPHTKRPSDRKANSRQEPTIVGPAVCSSFWRQIEPLFSFPSDTNICYLKKHGSIQSVVPTTKPNVDSFGDILLCQRLLFALIPEEGEDNENNETESNGYESTFKDEKHIKSNGFMEFSRVHNDHVCSILDYQTMSMDNRLHMEI
nr:hypothetical protein [Tanacetum cinerariifolium]